jgi:hypothetical protein
MWCCATQCGAVRRNVVLCGAMWCCAAQCGAVLCGAVLCCVVLYSAVRCDAMWCCAAYCGAVRRIVVLCGAMWCRVVRVHAHAHTVTNQSAHSPHIRSFIRPIAAHPALVRFSTRAGA